MVLGRRVRGAATPRRPGRRRRAGRAAATRRRRRATTRSQALIAFSVCSGQPLPFDELLERWQELERLGFDGAWTCDHLNRPSDPTGVYLDGWTALAALAARTERMRVGILVSSNTFHHPAQVAQMAVTVDQISGGRLELGLGTGWFEPEHRRFGIELPGPRERLERLAEAVEIVDRLLREETTTFSGRFYQLTDAAIRPRAVQQPRPPLTIGAHRPGMLRLCARVADHWNSYGTLDEIRNRSAAIDEECAAIGRDPAEIRRSVYVWQALLAEQGLPDPWQSRSAFEEVVGTYRALGIDEFVFDLPPRGRVLEEIATAVLPALRSAGNP